MINIALLKQIKTNLPFALWLILWFVKWCVTLAVLSIPFTNKSIYWNKSLITFLVYLTQPFIFYIIRWKYRLLKIEAHALTAFTLVATRQVTCYKSYKLSVNELMAYLPLLQSHCPQANVPFPSEHLVLFASYSGNNTDIARMNMWNIIYLNCYNIRKTIAVMCAT